MAGPAAICIGAVRRRPLEIVGLKVFSSLQGLAGERRTIYKKACVAVIVIAIDIGNGIGSKPAMLAESAAHSPGRPQLGSSMSPPVIGNCSKSCGNDGTAAVQRSRHRNWIVAARRECSTRSWPATARLLDVANCGRKLFEVLRHRRNGCCARKQTSQLDCGSGARCRL